VENSTSRLPVKERNGNYTISIISLCIAWQQPQAGMPVAPDANAQSYYGIAITYIEGFAFIGLEEL
jgi:hypothetical protein